MRPSNMKFRLPSSFRQSRTIRLHSFAFALLAIAGTAITTLFRVYTLDFFYLDAYFPVAVGHLVLAAATLFGVFAVTWSIFQALARRTLHERLGQIHFWLTLAGVFLSVGCLLAFSVGWGRSPAVTQNAATIAMYAIAVTVACQVVFPVAVVLSWLRPKTAST